MKVEIIVRNIRNVKVTTQLVESKEEDPELVTKLQVEAIIPPSDIARIISLIKQPIPVNLLVSSPQSTMDLNLQQELEAI